MSYSTLANRLRLPLGFVLAALYLVLARPTPLTVVVGGTIAFVGVLIRAWAAGHIVKNDRLATTGPYAHTRNPLYLGSFLIAAGFAVAGHWSLLVVVLLFFGLVYVPTMERERADIRTRFPGAFDEYERNVPGFLPRPLPWRAPAAVMSSARAAPFSFDLYMRHGEWKAGLGYLAAIGWLLLRLQGKV